MEALTGTRSAVRLPLHPALRRRYPMDPIPDSTCPSPRPDPRGQRSETYLSIRGATRALAAPLSVEDCAIQSMPDASPVKWHLAHTPWFFETFVLEPHLPGYRLHDAALPGLFNSSSNAS